jgi:hypothetical protein
VLAAVSFVGHMLMAGNDGYFCDELHYLADGMLALLVVGGAPAPGTTPTVGATAAPVEVPGTRSYGWSEDQVLAAVRGVAASDDAVEGGFAALAWPPPNHPDAEYYADRPTLPWTPGAWFVETRGMGRWWVMEAYGLVVPADDLARTHDPQRLRLD